MRHSYTKISMYMSCPMKKKGRYDLGIKEERGPAASRGVDIHAAFESAVLTGEPLPVEFTHYDAYIQRLRSCGAKPELKVAVGRDWNPTEYDNPDAWLIGIVDLVADQGETLFALDWKSGKIYDDHVKQKEFYSCLMADLYPKANKFVFANVYVDSKQEKTHTFTRDEVLHLRERWANRIAVMERDTDCAPTPSFGCQYCAVSKAKGGPCPF